MLFRSVILKEEGLVCTIYTGGYIDGDPEPVDAAPFLPKQRPYLFDIVQSCLKEGTWFFVENINIFYSKTNEHLVQSFNTLYHSDGRKKSTRRFNLHRQLEESLSLDLSNDSLYDNCN